MRFRLIALLLFAAACGKGDKKKSAVEDDHDHEPKNGGEMLVLGEHEGHLEVKLDHNAGAMTVWVSTNARKDLALDEAPVLEFTVDGDVQVTGEGDEHTWTFTHEKLKGEPQNVRFKLMIGGRSFTPKWDRSRK